MCMHPKLLELAEKAEFSMWTDEPWKPDGATIDWSSNYDREIQKFADLIVQEIEDYIKEAEGDIDYVRFLIDKNFK